MPKKKTDAGREYEVDGKRLTWHPLDDDGKPGNIKPLVIPLRLKLKVIRAMQGKQDDVSGMLEMIEAVVPGQSEVLDEMDVNDFVAMFNAFQQEYNALSGASLGE